jgi:4-nitrophenyl phosphatase
VTAIDFELQQSFLTWAPWQVDKSIDYHHAQLTPLSSRNSIPSSSIAMVFLPSCQNSLTPGVIWVGDKLLPNVQKTISYLRSQGKQLIFVSNNSTKSRRAYAQKFAKLGIPAKETEIFGSSYSAAIYLSRVLKFPKDKKVYVLGERGVEEELEAENISYVGGTKTEDLHNDFKDDDFGHIKPDPSIGAVLCALDQHITYKKLSRALMYLKQSEEVLFLATNTDSTYPTHGFLFPGAGTTTTIPLQFASNRKATNCGKPNQTMMDAIFARYELDRERTCMVGDRLDTDIQFGLQGKLGGTLLVLTGVHSLEDCAKLDTYPDYVIDGLGNFAALDTVD